MLQVDGDIDASAAPATNSRSGGGSGGSILLISRKVCSGTGTIDVRGGDAKAINGGGGGGGRIAVNCATSRFRGTYKAFGGSGQMEAGGAGSITITINNARHRTLIFDNNGRHPSQTFIKNYTDLTREGGRSWITTQYVDGFNVERLLVRGGSHLGFKHMQGRTLALNVDRLEGDLTGLLHVSTGNRVLIKSTPNQFPASFRVYSGGYFALPPNVLLKDLYYPSIIVEGSMTITTLSIGRGTEFNIRETVRELVQLFFCLLFCVYAFQHSDGKLASMTF